MNVERARTGEVGFCEECGGLVDLVLEPQDRAQALIERALKRVERRSGWTAEQFLARQAARMAWELAEMGAGLVGLLPPYFWHQLLAAGDAGKWHYEHGEWPKGMVRRDLLKDLRRVLVRLQLVLVEMAAALGEIGGEEVDLMREAVERMERKEG